MSLFYFIFLDGLFSDSGSALLLPLVALLCLRECVGFLDLM